VLSGTANVLYAVCALGGAGAISALANVAPDPLVELFDRFQAGDHERARALQLRLLPANIAVTATYGVPGLKAAMDMCGYTGGLPRRPLLPLPDSDAADLRQILISAEIL
jgi:4-hydroxy-2-oxoglutarate aldolase